MQRKHSTPDGAYTDAARQLAALQHTEHRTRIRALLPLIDELVRQGVSHAAIVSTLADAGIAMKEASVRQALYRWRKKRARGDAPAAFSSNPDRPVQQPIPESADSGTGSMTSKGDLVRLRRSHKTIDLSELAKLGRQK